MNPLIEKLEAHRIKMGLSKEKMARLIDVPYGSYVRWTNPNNINQLSPLAVKRIMSLEFMKDG